MNLVTRRGATAATLLLALQVSACALDVQPMEGEDADREVGQSVSALDTTYGAFFGGDTAPAGFLATHCSLLRNGLILAVAGSSYYCCKTFGTNNTRAFFYDLNLWSGPMTGNAPYPGTADAFCSGHAHDDQGRVIFQGGLKGYAGDNGKGIANSARFEFGFPANYFTQLGNTSVHWYPTLVGGARHMFLFPGRQTGGDSKIKRMAYGSTVWNNTQVVQANPETYPRAHLLPNGKFFIASPETGSRKNTMYNPVANTLSYTDAGSDTVPFEDNSGGLGIYDDWRGTSVLLPLIPSNGGYPSPKVALFNGVTAHAKTLQGASPTWQALAARPAEPTVKKRRHGSATLLPNGHVLLSGGIDGGLDSAAVKAAEIYDPVTNSWLLTSSSAVPRNYHSVALLLPDGRVWHASSSKDALGSDCGPNSICDLNQPDKTQTQVDFFKPYYVDHADRPTISSCPAIVPTDGSVFNFNVANSQGTNIVKVALMRAGSVTHAFDSDQRMIWLDITNKTASTVSVRGPYGAAAAPPGDYMLFALRDRGSSYGFKRFLPSKACWLRVEPQSVRYHVPLASVQATVDGYFNAGFRPMSIDGYTVGANQFFNIVFTRSDGLGAYAWIAGKTLGEIQAETSARAAQGYRMIHLDAYAANGTILHNAVYDNRPGPEWAPYYYQIEANHNTYLTVLPSQGYRPVNISVAVVDGTRYYAGLWDKANVGMWTLDTNDTEAQYQTRATSEVAAGRWPATVNAWMDGATPRIVSIFNQAPVGGFRSLHMMTGAAFQTEHDWRLSESQQLRSIAGYQVSGAARYIANWSTHPAP